MLLELYDIPSGREFVLHADALIGYSFDAINDTIILYTKSGPIELVNDQPFYSNWTEFLEQVRGYFIHDNEKDNLLPF